MLSNGFAIPIKIELTPSVYYRNTLLGMHGLACIALFIPSSLPVWIRLTIGLVVLVSGVLHLKRNTGHLNACWMLHDVQHWRTAKDQFQHRWRLTQIITVTQWFVGVRLQNEQDEKINLMIFCDQLDPETFRRLRVRLRFAQVDATSPGDTI